MVGFQEFLHLICQLVLFLFVFLDLEEHFDIELEEIFLSLREILRKDIFSFLILPGRLVLLYFRASKMIPELGIEWGDEKLLNFRLICNPFARKLDWFEVILDDLGKVNSEALR